MTQNQTLAAIRALGLSARVEDGEFRIAHRGLDADRTEATACYTDDREDAIGTAKAMIAQENA